MGAILNEGNVPGARGPERRTVRRFHRLRKFITYSALTVAGLLAISLAVMSTPWFRHYLQRELIRRLEEASGGHVEIGEFHFKPFLLEVLVRHLVVHGNEAPTDPPLLTVEMVQARLHPNALLERRLLLRSLVASGLSAHLHVSPDGETNIPGPKISFAPGEAVKSFMDLSVRRLSLDHANIYWNDREIPLRVSSAELSLQLTGNFRHRYSGSLAAEDLAVSVRDWSLPAIDLKGGYALTRDEFKAPDFELVGKQARGRFSIDIRNFYAPKMESAFQLQSDAALLAEVFHVKELRKGLIATEGTASWSGGKWEVKGNLHADKLQVRVPQLSQAPINASLIFQATPDGARVRNIRAGILGMDVQGEGSMTQVKGTPQFALHTQFRGGNLGYLMRTLAGSDTAWNHLNLNSTVSGTADSTWRGSFQGFQTRFKLALAGPQAPAAGLPLSGPLQGTLSVRNSWVVKVDEARLTTPRSTVQLQGTLDGPDTSLSVHATTSDFEEWQPLVQYLAEASSPLPLKLDSAAAFLGTVKGPTENAQIKGNLKVGEFSYSGYAWDGLEVSLALSPISCEISSGRLWHGGSSLEATGKAALQHWRLYPEAPVKLAVRTNGTSLGGIEAALGYSLPLHGKLSAQLTLNGTASHVDGVGDAKIENGSFYDEPFTEFSTRVKVVNSVWAFENLHLGRSQGSIEGKATAYPDRRTISLNLEGRGLRLAGFQHLDLCAASPNHPCSVDGDLGFSVQGEGPVDNLQLHSDWNIRNILVQGNPAGNLSGALEWHGKQASIHGQGQGDSLGHLDFTAALATTGDWPIILHGNFSDFHADPWIRAFAEPTFGPAIVGAGSLSVTGPLNAPSQLAARVSVNNLQVTFPSTSWKNAETIECHLSKNVLDIGRFHMRGPATDLQIEGQVRMGPSPTVMMQISGQSEASILGLLDAQLRATGGSTIEVRVTGSPRHPFVNGHMVVHDVGLSYGDLPVRLSGLNGEIRLEGERATLQSVHGVCGGGTVMLTGAVTLGDIPRYDVRAAVDQIRITYPTDFTSTIYGRLRLQGTTDRGDLTGELQIRQMFVGENVNLLARLTQPGATLNTETGGVNSPLASNIRLKVAVNSAPAVRLETPDLRLTGDVEMTIQGTLANPVAVGMIHLLNGEAIFRGNRYQLNRGEVSLTNPFHTQMVLDIEVQTRVQSYDLMLDITGPVDHLRFAYRSDPPLPSEDVLSLLALGYSRTEEQMSAAGTGSKVTQSVGTSAILSQALSNQMSGRIQRLFGVSRIKIDPNVGSPGSLSGTTVTVEQQITPDLTFTYVTNTAASQYRIIQFNYALSDSVSVIGVRDPNGVFGIEFRFRQRFK
jgi:translocation and assembly module TamB